MSGASSPVIFIDLFQALVQQRSPSKNEVLSKTKLTSAMEQHSKRRKAHLEECVRKASAMSKGILLKSPERRGNCANGKGTNIGSSTRHYATLSPTRSSESNQGALSRAARRLIKLTKRALQKERINAKLASAEFRRLQHHSNISSIAAQSGKLKVQQVLSNRRNRLQEKTNRLVKNIHEKLNAAEIRRFEYTQERARKAARQNKDNAIRNKQLARTRLHALYKAREKSKTKFVDATERRIARMSEVQSRCSSHLEKVKLRRQQMRALRLVQALFRDKRAKRRDNHRECSDIPSNSSKGTTSSNTKSHDNPKPNLCQEKTKSKIGLSPNRKPGKKKNALSNATQVVQNLLNDLKCASSFGKATDYLIKGGKGVEKQVCAFLSLLRRAYVGQENSDSALEQRLIHPRVFLSAILCAYYPSGIFGSHWTPMVREKMDRANNLSQQCESLHNNALRIIEKVVSHSNDVASDNGKGITLVWSSLCTFEDSFKQWKINDAVDIMQSMKQPFVELKICATKYEEQLKATQILHNDSNDTKGKEINNQLAERVEALTQLLMGTQKQIASFDRRLRRLCTTKDMYSTFMKEIEEQVERNVTELRKSGELLRYSPRSPLQGGKKGIEMIPSLNLPPTMQSPPATSFSSSSSSRKTPTESSSSNGTTGIGVAPSMRLGQIMQNARLVHQMLLEKDNFKLPVKEVSKLYDDTPSNDGKRQQNLSFNMNDLQLHTARIARRAFWDKIVESSLLEMEKTTSNDGGSMPKESVICSLLGELAEAFCALVPRNRRFCDRIREHLDPDLVKQQLFGNVFTAEMLCNMVVFICEQCILQLEAPARNAKTRALMQEILTKIQEAQSNATSSSDGRTRLVKLLPIIYQFGFDKIDEIKGDSLNVHLNHVSRWLQTANRGVQYELKNFRKKYNLPDDDDEIEGTLASKLPRTAQWLRRATGMLGSNSKTDIETGNGSNSGTKVLQTFVTALVDLIHQGKPLSNSRRPTSECTSCPETLDHDIGLLHKLQNQYQACIILAQLRLVFRQFTSGTRKSRDGQASTLKLNHFCETYLLEKAFEILIAEDREKNDNNVNSTAGGPRKTSMLDQIVELAQNAIALCCNETVARRVGSKLLDEESLNEMFCAPDATMEREESTRQAEHLSRVLRREMTLSSNLMQVIDKRFAQFLREELAIQFGLLQPSNERNFAGKFIQSLAKSLLVKPLMKIVQHSYKVYRPFYDKLLSSSSVLTTAQPARQVDKSEKTK